MKVITRNMVSEVVETNDGYGYAYQASLNSDGCLTLREYLCDDKEHDKIICFTSDETRAILQLFRLIKNSGFDLPF